MISATEIIIIVAGFLAVILGFIIPAGTSRKDGDWQGNGDTDGLSGKNLDNVKNSIDTMVEASLEDAFLKYERRLDRLTNEKISAINEYYETVMKDIHGNHEEVMFMYDMLNNKHKNLKNTVSEVTQKAREAKEAAREAQDIASKVPSIKNNVSNISMERNIDRSDDVVSDNLSGNSDAKSGISRIRESYDEEKRVVYPANNRSVEKPSSEELRNSDWSAVLSRNIKKERALSTASFEEGDRRDTLVEESLKERVKEEKNDTVNVDTEISSEQNVSQTVTDDIFAPLELAAAKKVNVSSNSFSGKLKDALKEELVDEVRKASETADLTSEKSHDEISMDSYYLDEDTSVNISREDNNKLDDKQIENNALKDLKAFDGMHSDSEASVISQMPAQLSEPVINQMPAQASEPVINQMPVQTVEPVVNQVQSKEQDSVTPNSDKSSKVVNIATAKDIDSKKNVAEEQTVKTSNDPMSQNKQILEMHKAGKSNMVIARELGVGIGEVKLVVDLSTKHKRARQG
ncbi:MAG: hypothetical protein K6B41_15000 [Butyrivibrio sp.]|nr:hypothetical protein [Butyrivibrio sp.]